MTVLKIRHRTTYRYREPVRLGAHRMMLRPRESRDVRLLSSMLEMTPAASISWTAQVMPMTGASWARRMPIWVCRWTLRSPRDMRPLISASMSRWRWRSM
jgi:hypothetical protein